jgi:hypothetical protein
LYCFSIPRPTRRVVRTITTGPWRWIAVGAIAIACALAAPPVLASFGSTPQDIAPCLASRHLPRFTAYDLGAQFAGLPRTHVARYCDAPDQGHFVEEPFRMVVTWVSSDVYGSCTPETPEGSCLLPLEVQSWPECDRNYSAYGPARDLTPRSSYRLTGSHKLPAGVLEGVGRIELYDGRTTVVIYTDEQLRLARLAAHALARRIAPTLRSTSFAHLRALAVSTRGCHR